MGFEACAERMRAHDVATANTLLHFARQRARFSRELSDLAARHGHGPELDSSWLAGLHRGWIAVKDVVTGRPEAILEAAAAGEERAMGEYDEALEHEDLTGEVRRAVLRQQEAINAALDQVRQLAAHFAD